MRSLNSMKILMITSEAVPYAKTGGLADVITALSQQLSLNGHDVRILLPRYYFIDKDILTPAGPEYLEIPGVFGKISVSVYKTDLPDSGVEVYFIDDEQLYGRDGIYGTADEPFFHDNAKRFSLLSRSAYYLCRMLNWYPDIIHAHDWPSALAPVYLNGVEKKGEFLKTGAVFTIHNLGYQGIFSKHDIHYTHLAWEDFHESGLEYHDRLNFLKAGIKNADIITTVSPTYAKEIQTERYGNQMEGLLSQRKKDLYGIINGIDYTIWNPETDPLIPFNYSGKDPGNKKRLKTILQKEAGLKPDPEIPLIGMISRLAGQKGFNALCGEENALYKICMEIGVQFVILGTGEKWIEDSLRTLDCKLPNLKAFLEFDERLAHIIEAGCDFFFMPSEYEPCGLNQIYSLRYGTVPIVRRTGGLADTVEELSRSEDTGTGFLFDKLTPLSVYNIIKTAADVWEKNRACINNMKIRGMKKRFLWKESAGKYEDLYRKAVKKRSEE